METFLLHLKHAGIHNKYNKYRKTKLDDISTLTDNFSKRTNVVLKIKIINKQIITPSCKHEHTCTTANPPSLLVSVHRQPLKQHLQRQVCNTEDEGLNMSVFIYTCLSSKFSVSSSAISPMQQQQQTQLPDIFYHLTSSWKRVGIYCGQVPGGQKYCVYCQKGRS